MTAEIVNHQAEQALLGSLIIDRDAMPSVAPNLPYDAYRAFADRRHQIIFRAMHRLFEQRTPVEFATLAAFLDQHNQLDATGGMSYLAGLAALMPTAVHAPYYADAVRKSGLNRSIVAACESVIDQAQAEPLDVDQVIQSIRVAAEPYLSGAIDSRYGSILDIADRHMAEVEARWNGTINELVIPTGFRELDRMMHGGFRGGDLVFLGGRPGSGKTSWALGVTLHAARMLGRSVLFNCLEMRPEDLLDRMIAAETGLPFELAHRTLIGVGDKERWRAANAAIAPLPIALHAHKMTARLIAQAERMAMDESPLGLIVVDHIGLLQDELRKESVAQNTATISHRLKAGAMDLNVPVLVLSQLNRDVEAHPPFMPQLSNLKNSGALEEDADYVLLLYRRMYYVEREMLDPDAAKDYLTASNLHRVELAIAKNRNGEVGPLTVGWNPKSMSFHEREAA